MPNPNNDLACMGGLGFSKKEEHCKAHCSVASSHQNCYSICMSNDLNLYSFSLLDNICRYAYSENCAKKSDIERPGREGGPGIGPIPIPYSIQEYMILPLSIVDIPNYGSDPNIGNIIDKDRPNI